MIRLVGVPISWLLIGQAAATRENTDRRLYAHDLHGRQRRTLVSSKFWAQPPYPTLPFFLVVHNSEAAYLGIVGHAQEAFQEALKRAFGQPACYVWPNGIPASRL